MLHNDSLPVPIFRTFSNLTCDDVEMIDIQSDSDSEFEYCSATATVRGFSQGELNDLIRDLNLSKKSAELLASRLKEKQCLQPEVNITSYRTREETILPYITEENSLVYCNDVSGLLHLMGLSRYRPED